MLDLVGMEGRRRRRGDLHGDNVVRLMGEEKVGLHGQSSREVLVHAGGGNEFMPLKGLSHGPLIMSSTVSAPSCSSSSSSSFMDFVSRPQLRLRF